MKKYLILSALLYCFGILSAQQTPAPPQSQPILITGATAHLGNGKVIENSAIAFENGKLSIVADAGTIRIDGNKNYKMIDGTGKHIYPGFIASNTPLGLKEIDAVRSTKDYQEVGRMNPNVRSLIAYNTDSRVTPTVRSNGTLLAQIVPQGGRISGSSSVVSLDAWNWEDAAYATDEGIHLRWPRMFRLRGRNAEPGVVKKNEKYDEQIREIEDFFKEAKAYTAAQSAPTNLRYEAMQGLFDKSKTLYVHANAVKMISSAVLFAQKYQLRVVIVGGREAWMATDLLQQYQVPVILRAVQALPGREDADIDQPFKTPAMLQAAGILFSFSINGAWEQRNLPFQAGQAVGFGLEYEAAISALTLNPAKIMGIDKSVGSLEVGKDATLILSAGDALDMRTCKIEQAFIQGKEIDLDNKQKALYRKFKAKYE